MELRDMMERRVVLLLLLAVVGTAVLMRWPSAEAKPPPKPKTVVVTKTVEVTPEACSEFVRDADAFVSVTGDFLAVQNRAIDAVLAFDADKVKDASQRMTRLQGRYDIVMDAYAISRKGCI
jgi:hypothetical protein